MATLYTHPHVKINVIDSSIYVPEVREQNALFRPIFFMRAQKGPLNVPYYCRNYTEATKVFGAGTFDMTTDYYSSEAFFTEGIFPRAGCFIVRLADDTAKAGTIVLELKVQKGKVKQWERDVNGYYVYDPESDERVPLLNEDDQTQVEEDGVKLTWNVRTLKENQDHPETLANLKPTTYGSGPTEYVVYPILAAKAKSVGAFANDTGFKFFLDQDNLDHTLARSVKSVPYSFGMVTKTYGQDTVSPILSRLNNHYETFVVRPHQVDLRTNRQVSFDKIMKNNFDEADIPWDLQLYTDNIETIGKLICDVEDDDDTLTDPFMVNLTSEYNINGKPMPHVEFTDESLVLNKTFVMYLREGSDGTLTDEVTEELTRQYLDDLIYPDILDSAKFPFDYIVDTGVSLKTKESFINFMGRGREDFKVLLSTQDKNLGRYNTKAEDLSTGMSLYSSALLQPESMEKGTECCRVTICMHAGKVADTIYDAIVPFTYDIALKKALYLSTEAIAGQPTGLPNSAITVFREFNWSASDADLKQQSWESGLNYIQNYDMTGVHWPAIRSVYRYETSVLSSDFFTDAIVFIKHIVRFQWAKYVGMEMEFSRYASIVSKSVQDELTAMLNGALTATASLTQTAEQAKIGYESTLSITLLGNAQQRIWSVDINCKRAGYNSEA